MQAQNNQGSSSKHIQQNPSSQGIGVGIKKHIELPIQNTLFP